MVFGKVTSSYRVSVSLDMYVYMFVSKELLTHPVASPISEDVPLSRLQLHQLVSIFEPHSNNSNIPLAALSSRSFLRGSNCSCMLAGGDVDVDARKVLSLGSEAGRDFSLGGIAGPADISSLECIKSIYLVFIYFTVASIQ